MAKKIEGMEYFLNDVFQNYLVTKNHIDTKINWLLGICAIIMGLLLPFTLTNDGTYMHYGILLIALSAILAFLISLLSLELPSYLTKHAVHEDNVMFFVDHKTSEEIFVALKKMKTHDDILREYSRNIHNISERNIKIKNKLFKLASKTLFTGIVCGLVVIVISFF